MTSLGNEGLSYGDLWKIRMLYNYISRNRATIGKSECSKLFVPGSKFKKYRPDSGEDITPRKKPSKYLGIAEDKAPEKTSTEEQPEEPKHPDEDKDNNTENSEYDYHPKVLQFFQEVKSEDISSIKENTIFRAQKRA